MTRTGRERHERAGLEKSASRRGVFGAVGGGDDDGGLRQQCDDSWSEYDPAENIFWLHYRTDVTGEGKEYAVLETRGLDGMEFIHYMPYNY